ncbi:hypothetical protein VTK26DRAFT_1895 [Humicola hyalothermophila]
MCSFFITISLLVLSATASPAPGQAELTVAPKLEASIRPKLEPSIRPKLAATPAPQALCPLTASVPPCGVGCLASAANVAGCSDLLDFACQCQSSARIYSLASGCVVAACGPATASVVSSVGSAICSECV